MMRGPSYDDSYITRKMSTMPTFMAPGPQYGRQPPMGPPGYMQDSYTPYNTSYSTTYLPGEASTTIVNSRRSVSPIRTSYRVPSSTQLILNRVALSPLRTTPTVSRVTGYPPMGPPPPRMVPRAMHYDYDYPYGGYGGYGYGGGYGGGYAPPPPPPQPAPRMSRYDNYMDDEFLEPSSYVPRTRSRPQAPEDDYGRQPQVNHAAPTTTRTADTSSKPYAPAGMLQEHVDNMRIKLKSLAFSLDPSGPVPDIIIPESKKKSAGAEAAESKYSKGPKHLACVEFAGGQPMWRRRARARYPSEDPDHVAAQCKAQYIDKVDEPDPEKLQEKMILKDRLSNKIHKFMTESLNADQFDKYLKTYRQPGVKPRPPRHYWKPKAYIPDESNKASMLDSSYTSRFTLPKSDPKWEEPDQVFGAGTDRKPFSKTEDAVEEHGEEKKERRKKKKSREREVEAICAAPAADVCSTEVCDTPAPEAAPAPAPADPPSVSIEETVEDEKERKKLEKKKRKAEREAAAKAAMEAELAALEQAEAELARLEAESCAIKTDTSSCVPEVHSAPAAAPAPAPAPVEAPAPEAPAAEVKSESAAEKCESSAEVVCEGVSVPETPLGELPPSPTPPQVPPQEEELAAVAETTAGPELQEPEEPVEPQSEEPAPPPPTTEEEEPVVEAAVVEDEVVAVPEPEVVEEPPMVVEEEPPMVVEEEPPMVVQEEAAFVVEEPALVEEEPAAVEEEPAIVEEEPAIVEAEPVIEESPSEVVVEEEAPPVVPECEPLDSTPEGVEAGEASGMEVVADEAGEDPGLLIGEEARDDTTAITSTPDGGLEEITTTTTVDAADTTDAVVADAPEEESTFTSRSEDPQEE